MATRFGFMKSNKAGKCFYCKAEFAEGERVGFDNNIKRRTCAKCAERIIGEGQNVPHEPPAEGKPKGLFKNAQLETRVAIIEESISELRDMLKRFVGEE